jgi:hypothetical protein
MREYVITTPTGMQTTVLLSDEKARQLGLTPTEPPASAAKAKTPANKMHKPVNKAAAVGDKGDAGTDDG